MRKFLLYTFAAFLCLSASGQQNFFTDAGTNRVFSTNGNRVIIPDNYRAFSLNVQGLRTFLWSLPSEQSLGNNRSQAPVISLPMPDGSMARFRVWESSVMAPELAAKFPEIRSFLGQGIDDPYASVRFDFNPYFGFSAQILSVVSGRIFIDPYARGDINNYIGYYTRNAKIKDPFICNFEEDILGNESINAGPCRGTQLYTYRLALACTGEYAVAVAGPSPTVPAVAAAMNTAVTRVTGVYEQEASIRMVLVPNNDLLIFLNGTTDPYTNNNGGAMLTQNVNTCNSIIGINNYDIGHVFSTGGGGVAYLSCICTSNKAGGVTGLSNPVGDPFYIDYVAHEMGHQFGGNHTFNSVTGNCGGNRNGSTAYEVGSGTSIQGYAGICGSDNIQPNSDPFFHSISFDEISNYASGGGGTCAAITSNGNILPVITAMNNNGSNIPLNTPFTLSGLATDANGDALTYSWEEWDLGPSGAWNSGANSTTAPLFKSRIPKITGERTFPDIAVILAGYPANPPAAMGGLKGETLPLVARALKFRLTVRDNRVGGGGVVTGGDGCQAGFTGIFQVNTIAGTGPFVVTVPNGGESWPGATSQTIIWNPAGTNAAPINAANVKISLSTDGGVTYPTVIVASTPNDGSETITIPSTPSTTARIKIEAVGNIFFDISNANFTITAPLTGFSFNNPAPAVSACPAGPGMSITLGTISNGGFSNPITLAATAGVPTGTNVTFGTNPVNPGSSSVVTLNNTNTLLSGSYTITITGTATAAPTQTRDLTFTITGGAGPAITAHPVNQTICVGANTSFTVVSATATNFQWQVNPGTGFVNVSNGGVYSGATTATLSITGATASMNSYQYRCVASVQCGNTNSLTASLTVNLLPAVSADPLNVTICAGSNTSFTVNATGAGLTYQWQVNPGSGFVNVTNGGVYSGATSATLLITGATAAMTTYQYHCVVSGTCTPSATSNNAVLTVISPVSVTIQPTDAIVCDGGNTSFTAGGSGSGVNYQWQINTGTGFVNVANGGIYSGTTTTTLTLTGVNTIMSGYQFRCQMNNATCITLVNSNAATLTVNSLPAISFQPANATICAGGNHTFSVTASGSGINYQWEVNPGGGFVNVTNTGVYSGANSASLTITGATVSMSSYQYRCVVSGTCTPPETSGTVVLTVNAPITFTTQPVDLNICATGNAIFSVAVTGSSPAYQWQESTNGGNSWNNINNGGVYSGVTTNTLTLTAVVAGMNGNVYRCIVAGAAPCGIVNSTNGILNVTPQPVISASPFTSLMPGLNTTLSVNVAPAPSLTFTWSLNGTVLPSATGNSVVATVNDLGNYRVVVTSATGSCTSELFNIKDSASNRLFIFPSPNNGRFTVSYYNESGANLTRTIVIYDSKGARVYSRRFNISGPYTLLSMDLQPSQAGVYHVVVGDTNGKKIIEGKVLVQ